MVEYKTAVVAIVEYDGQILIGKKINKQGILSNSWHIPGGKVEIGESEEQALKREIKEEAGIEIKVDRLFDTCSNNNFQVKWYLCSALTNNINQGSDLAEVLFVPKSEVKNLCDSKAISLWPPKVLEYFSYQP